ncbi:MAG: PD40 domain-containing protein, partial [Myxococcales bacterium]|nr:PD40 domain-containing protein [Myxococcales bacterium]
AERVAMTAERAHDRLSVELGHAPLLKTHIVVRDDTDTANGSASATPFPRIYANVVAPYEMSVLMAYDDWIDILITHEYVHIIHLDTVHGLPKLVNAVLGFGVLGKVWTPNIIQPRWVVEGLATKYESSFGSQGRFNSAQFDMLLRMGVLEQSFETLDQVNSSANVFPFSTSVYLYGLHFMHYIAERYGRDKIAELGHIYGGQAVPLSINRAIKKVLGVDFDQLWEEFRQHTARRFQAQARRIRARGIREGRRLTYSTSEQASGQFTRAPFWSPDDRYIYFYEDDAHTNPGIRRIRSTGGRIREGWGIGRQGADMDIEDVFQVQEAAGGAFIGATGDIVFNQSRNHDFRYGWNDLHRWRGPGHDIEQLTFGKRARDPEVSPDGRTVVFARNDVGQSRLGFLELDTLDVIEVAAKDRVQQVTGPAFSPDGRKVAFSGWRDGGYRDIYVYDRETEALERVTADRYLDLQPDWTPDGAYIVFASDRDDVFNIYAYQVETGLLQQVTNVLGGAFDPVVSHDGARLAYIGYRSTGYDLWVMELDPARFFEPLPSVSPLRLKDQPAPPVRGEDGAPRQRPLSARNSPYRPIKTMYPRLIMPAGIEISNANGLQLGLSTSVSDVLGFHYLGGSYTYLFAYNKSVGSVDYSFNQLLPNFSLGYGRGFFERTGDFERYVYDHRADELEGDPGFYQVGYHEQVDRVSASVNVPVVRHPIHQTDADLSYRYTHYTNVDAELEPIDPNAPTSTRPFVGGVGEIALGMAYSNERSVRFGYGNTSGRRLGMRVSLIDPALGGSYRDLQITGNYQEYLSMPWRGHQTLALRIEGGAAAGGFGRRGAFFVGGYSMDQDIIRTIIQRSAFSEQGVLRGFSPGALQGNYYSVLNAEYRIPIADVERGLGSLPLFMRRILVAGFTDFGGAWSGPFTADVIKVGVGASLILSFKIGYAETVNVFFTYAHGFDDVFGIDYFRMLIARSF